MLVNHRSPRRESICHACSEPRESSYLRDVPTQRRYCNQDCYIRNKLMNLAMPWLSPGPAEDVAASLRSLDSITSLAVGSCWSYAIQIGAVSLSLAEAFLHMHDRDEPGRK